MGQVWACDGGVLPLDEIPTLSTAPVLSYGETVLSTDYPEPWDSHVISDPVACHSAKDGITCWNTETRHGFQIARNTAVFW